MRVTLYRLVRKIEDAEFPGTQTILSFDREAPQFDGAEPEPIVFAPLPSEETRATVLTLLDHRVVHLDARDAALAELEEAWKS